MRPCPRTSLTCALPASASRRPARSRSPRAATPSRKAGSAMTCAARRAPGQPRRRPRAARRPSCTCRRIMQGGRGHAGSRSQAERRPSCIRSKGTNRKAAAGTHADRHKRAAAFSRIRPRGRTSRTTSAARHTSGLPANVDPWSPGFITSATASVTSTAPMGSPPARAHRPPRALPATGPGLAAQAACNQNVHVGTPTCTWCCLAWSPSPHRSGTLAAAGRRRQGRRCASRPGRRGTGPRLPAAWPAS